MLQSLLLTESETVTRLLKGHVAGINFPLVHGKI